MRLALSGLTTRGRCLLAGGIAAALCSLILDERDLLRIAAFAIALPLLASALAARARVGLTATREVRPPRAPVGSVAEIRLTVRGRGRLPTGGLLIEDTVPHALGDRVRFAVEHVPRGSGATLSYPLQPIMRGVHRVGPLRAKVTDLFGLAEFDRELGGQHRFVVVPTVAELHGMPHGSGIGSGEEGSVRLRSGHGEDDAIVRPYRTGDDMRKVHWKSTARRDELVVRVEERPARGGSTVLLDHRATAHRGAGPTASIEWAVSFAGSACLHLHHCGQPVRLVTVDGRSLLGSTSGSAGFLADRSAAGLGTPLSGLSGDTAILDALAALPTSHQHNLACGQDPAVGQELLAVLGSVDTDSVGELLRYRSQRSRSMAVLLDVALWGERGAHVDADPVESARLLRGAGWNVVIAGPADPIPDVWRALCQATTPRSDLTGAQQ